MAAEYQKEIERILGAQPQLRRLFDVPKLMAAYNLGQESGVKAEEAPMLKQIEAEATSPRDLFHTSPLFKMPFPVTGTLGEPASFRKGYADGLGAFLETHNVDLKMMGLHGTPDALAKDTVLLGYLKGMRRESPGVARAPFMPDPVDYSENRRLNISFDQGKRNWIDDFNRPPQVDLQAIIKTNQEQNRGGYRLGFVVGVARDFGIALNGLEIPTDNTGYNALMQGLRAEPRPMPVEQKPQRRSYELKESFNKFDRPAQGIWIYDAVDDAYYQTGLKVWLGSQGLEPVYGTFIRQPEALRAFKAALEGQILPEYQPQSSGLDRLISTAPDYTIKPLSSRYDRDELYIIKEINFIGDKYKPSRTSRDYEDTRRSDPLVEARRAAAFAYELGQSARASRKNTPQTGTQS